METIQERFARLRDEETDIQAHFMALHKLASKCNSIVELGFRKGVSATALYYGLVTPLVDCSHRKLTCYDTVPLGEHEKFLFFSKKVGMPQFEFIQGDSRKVTIPKCQLLFIDTWHVYRLLKKELKLHSPNVERWIAIHDTTTFGPTGEHGLMGLWPAIEEFVADNPFRIKDRYEEQNGLTVLERTQPN